MHFSTAWIVLGSNFKLRLHTTYALDFWDWQYLLLYQKSSAWVVCRRRYSHFIFWSVPQTLLKLQLPQTAWRFETIHGLILISIFPWNSKIVEYFFPKYLLFRIFSNCLVQPLSRLMKGPNFWIFKTNDNRVGTPIVCRCYTLKPFRTSCFKNSLHFIFVWTFY